jgi:hypothetical protein
VNCGPSMVGRYQPAGRFAGVYHVCRVWHVWRAWHVCVFVCLHVCSIRVFVMFAWFELSALELLLCRDCSKGHSRPTSVPDKLRTWSRFDSHCRLGCTLKHYRLRAPITKQRGRRSRTPCFQCPTDSIPLTLWLAIITLLHTSFSRW